MATEIIYRCTICKKISETQKEAAEHDKIHTTANAKEV